jgi:hypothetical protein
VAAGFHRVVHAADPDRDQLPERWDAYGEDTIGDAPTVDVAAKTGAQNRRLVQLAGDAEPGLQLPVIRPLCAFQWFVDTPQGGSINTVRPQMPRVLCRSVGLEEPVP